MVGVTKATITDSPENMRPKNMGYAVIIAQGYAEPCVKKGTKTADNSPTK